jgi:hypothetical protein
MADVRHPFTVVEIDLPTCSRTYGVAPCTAAVGVTGDAKCYNTFRTCQDRANFDATTTTLRLCLPTEDLPYDALPCLRSVRVTPGEIDPGRSIGTRGKVKISAGDFPTGDALIDRYIVDRGYDPSGRGTFWPKLRARIPSLQGAPLRLMRGELGEDLSTYTTEHYFVETLLVDADGVDLVAKDALSFCDPKKAQCPVVSLGRLSTAISAVANSWSLTPVGIGDAYYPATGFACMSGKEIVEYTRSGDVITIVGLRGGVLGTVAQEHDEDAIFQEVVIFSGQSAAEIVYSLLADYTPGIDAAWLDLPAWEAEADTYIGHLYDAIIPAPTSVKTLLDEMMVQAGCSLWWDPVRNRVMFQTLRPVAPSEFVLDSSRIMADSFRAKEQPDKRVSQHWTRYGLSDPTNKVDKENNFKAAVVRVDTEAEIEYGAAAYDQVLARYISINNRPAAERLNAIKLARFRDPPRQAQFSLFPTSPNLPGMGEGRFVVDPSLQLPDGSPATVPFYITSVTRNEDSYDYLAEELIFAEDAVPDTERVVYIDVDRFDVNLRTLYDSLYSSVPSGATVSFYLAPDAYVGSTILGGPAITVGTWPGDTIVNVIIGTPGNDDSGVFGRGGDGGGYPGDPSGQYGSTAIYTRRVINLSNYGTVGGGGGGGQGRVGLSTTDFAFSASGGGGGAGFNGYNGAGDRRGGRGGPGGVPGGEDGTLTDGGEGFRPDASTSLDGFTGGGSFAGFLGPGGNGGSNGNTGRESSGAEGHSLGGAAIDGASFVTMVVPGTILGAQIN